MKITFLVAFALVSTTFVSTLNAQEKPSALDQFIDGSAVIIVGKCLRVGPVNILLRANVEIEVIYAVKGGEMPKTVTVDSQYGMQVGKYYMLASKFAPTEKLPVIRTDSRDSVIPVASADEAEKLKTLPQRIAVLRTLNIRIDELESEIRRHQFELEALRKVKGNN
ncbi:MAG: hypothetical protein QM785_09795 [Pyrinomonadaceae bacterium]